MKLPNGFGSVYKLSGKRRKPWCARKTIGWTFNEEKGKSYPIYKFIGYYQTRKDALTALADYNDDPRDISHVTFAEIYQRWSEEHFENIDRNNQAAYKRAFNRCRSLHNKEMVNIHLDDLQDVVDRSGLHTPSLRKIKTLLNSLWDYCIKHDILTKKVSIYVNIAKAGNPNTIVRTPFTKDEIQNLWDRDLDIPLFLIHTGLRVCELYDLKWENVHLEERYFDVLKSKTEAGVRSVPIAEKIVPILEKHTGSEYVFTNDSGRKFLDSTFRKRYWNLLGLNHYPHDTRHTCISLLTEAGVDERIIKSIVGHKGQGVTQTVYTHIGIETKLEAINKI